MRIFDNGTYVFVQILVDYCLILKFCGNIKFRLKFQYYNDLDDLLYALSN